MEEASGSECVPDLKELEVKVGRKTPEGLLRWMRQDAAQRGEQSKVIRQESTDSVEHGLDEKIRKLKVEMVRLIVCLLVPKIIYGTVCVNQPVTCSQSCFAP